MAHYVYDGSFEGLLTCIFYIYQTREPADSILDEQHQQFALLGNTRQIETNDEYAARVLRGLDARSDDKGARLAYHLFLSELSDVAMLIYRLVKIIIDRNDPGILQNYADETILKAAQIEKMISREIHRMHAFVRFQKNHDGLFYAAIAPDFNILPLLIDHFERRYADQPWVIFDTKRHYGLYYNLQETIFVAPDHPILLINTDQSSAELVDEKEVLYQTLWENYFHSVNISERNNPKLHLRHVPRRYWKYLVEKRYALRH